MKVRYTYLFIGIGFGMMFPIGASIFELIRLDLGLSFFNLILIRHTNKLMYMIDSAPIWLGLFAMLGGISKEKSLILLDKFENVATKLSCNSVKLNEESKNVLDDLNNTLQSLGSDYEDIAGTNLHMSHQIQESKTDLTHLNDESLKLYELINSLKQVSDIFKEGNENIEKGLLVYIRQVDEMNDFFRTIEDIGRQIDILSLNSSIEANKYGAIGKSFAVVAQSIRSLALRSKEINTQLKAQLKEIETGTSELKIMISTEKRNIKNILKSSEIVKSSILSYMDTLKYFTSRIQNITSTSEDQNRVIQRFQDDLVEISTAKGTMINNLESVVESELEIINSLQFINRKKAKNPC